MEEGCKGCKKELEGVEECCVSLSLGDMATALVNSQQLWLCTQGHEVGPAHMPSWMVEELKKLYLSLGALCQLLVVGDVVFFSGNFARALINTSKYPIPSMLIHPYSCKQFYLNLSGS